jgi:ribonuclease G
MRKLIVNMASRQKRYAVIEDGELLKLEVAAPGQASKVGNIYLGNVVKVLPGMDAVFVDYGTGKNGFLHRDDLPAYQLVKNENESNQNGAIGHYVRQGEKLLVQVKRDETRTKGAKLSGLVELSTKHLVYIKGIDYVGVSKKFENPKAQQRWRKLGVETKQADEGLIIRTGMEKEPEEVFFNELHLLRNQYEGLKQKASAFKSPGLVYESDTFLEGILSEMSSAKSGEILIDEFEGFQQLKHAIVDQERNWVITYYRENKNIFSATDVENQIEKALKKIVWLQHGGYLVFEETEACTVIDVNTGKFTGKSGKEQTIFETNLQAAKEVVHQLRIRNISGIILIDFINMKDARHRQQVMEIVSQESVNDEIRTQVIGFTQLGVLQLTRKRTSPSIGEKFTENCPTCQGNGRIESAETIAFRLERELFEYRNREEEAVWIEASKNVIEILLGPNEHYKPILEEAAGRKILITVLPGPLNQYFIKRFGSLQELQTSISSASH